MKKTQLIVIGLSLALVSALIGLATAMTPAPSGADKSLVVMMMLLFVVGIVMVLTGIVRAIRRK